MNLLGLLLAQVIGRNLATETGARRSRALRGAVGVTAGKMSITLRFGNGPLTMARGLDGRLDAAVRGGLDGLLQVSLGRSVVGAFLGGAVRFSGNPLLLLRLVPLLRAPRPGQVAP